MSYGVIAEGLRKRYGQVEALKGISFSVRPGELFGLLGPDGAGKTTLFRILATLLLPDEGRAEVLGLDIVRDWRQIRRLVGYMPGRFSLYQDLSVEENLRFFATIFQTTVDRGEPALLRHHLPDDGRGQLRPDPRYLYLARAFQESSGRQAVGRHEAKAGPLLCPYPLPQVAIP